MPPGTILLVILVIGVLVAAVMALTSYLGNRKSTISSADKRELADLRTLVYKIDQLAYSQREINPELSVQIIDEIRQHTLTQKELP